MHRKYKFMDDSATCEKFLVQLQCQTGAKNRKIFLVIYQCAAHSRDTTALKNIKVIFFPPNCTSCLQPLDMGIIHAFICQYRKELMWKAVTMIYRELCGDAGLPDM
jgi:hypothetical protein